MTYGDGSSNANPLVELDVAAHEMSHGVTENTANLNYSGDAGGLNEATSDIFGTATEWYTNNASDTPDYLIGEEININGNGTPLRYMDKPSKDGASKDCWSSSLSGLDPHYSSGPLNHWYYMASEGTGSKTINGVSYSTTACNGTTFTGIGHLKVEKIWYRTPRHVPHVEQQLRGGPHRRDQGGQGPLRRRRSAECTGIEKAFSGISVPAGSETCGGTTPPPSSSLVNGGFESGPDRLDRHVRPHHEQHGPPGPQRLVEALARGQRDDGVRVRAAGVHRPIDGHLAHPDLLDPDRHLRDDHVDAVRQGDGADQRRHEAQLLNLSTPKSSWVQKSIDLTSYKGTSVTLKFAATEDSSLQTSFVIDDVATSF